MWPGRRRPAAFPSYMPDAGNKERQRDNGDMEKCGQTEAIS